MSLESAKRFAHLFFKVNRKYYSGFPTAVMFRTLGDYLRYSLSKKYISKEDLYQTDKHVLLRIKPFLKKDPQLRLLFDRLNSGSSLQNDPGNFDSVIFVKSRAVDPLCNYRGKVQRFSDIEHRWKKIMEKELKPKQYFIRFNR